MSFENEINWNIINAVTSTLDNFFCPEHSIVSSRSQSSERDRNYSCQSPG